MRIFDVYKFQTTVTVKGIDYLVYRYNTRSNMPRPESYTQDIKKAQSVPDKAQFWQVSRLFIVFVDFRVKKLVSGHRQRGGIRLGFLYEMVQ